MKPPAFQFYPSDFLSSTSEMTAEEVGVHIRLLCHQWIKGGLPNDDGRLMSMAGQCQASSVAYAKTRFGLCDDGQLRHPRLEAERSKQEAFREKQAINGAKRWPEHAKPNPKPNPKPHAKPHAKRNGVAMPMDMPNACSLSPSPSSIQRNTLMNDDGSSPPASPGNANADATPTAGEVSGQEGPTPEAAGGAKEPKQVGEGGGSGKGGSIDPGATSDPKVEELLAAYPKKNWSARPMAAKAIAEHGFDEVMDRTRLWVETLAGRHQFLPNPVSFFSGRWADDPPEQRVDPFMLKRQLEALDEAILDCAGNPDSLRYTRDDCTPALRREYQALLARRKKMLLG